MVAVHRPWFFCGVWCDVKRNTPGARNVPGPPSLGSILSCDRLEHPHFSHPNGWRIYNATAFLATYSSTGLSSRET